MKEQFDKRIDFERLSERVPDGGGGYEEKTWGALYSDVPCWVKPARSGKDLYLDKAEIIADLIVLCGRLDGLTEKDRAKYEGAIFDITFVQNGSGRANYMKVYIRGRR